MSHEQVYARQLREDQMKHALDDITAERERQIEVEGCDHSVPERARTVHPSLVLVDWDEVTQPVSQ